MNDEERKVVEQYVAMVKVQVERITTNLETMSYLAKEASEALAKLVELQNNIQIEGEEVEN